MESFASQLLLPDWLLDRVTQLRVDDPERSQRAAIRRARRDTIAPQGRLNLIAADHPARGAVQVGDRPLRMADRRDLLARVIRVLAADAADGVLATMDLLEELLLLDDLLREAGGPSFLDNRVLVASLNRGGLSGSAWELDDAWAGPEIQTLVDWRLDGGKALCRVLLDDPASLKTMILCAEAIRELQEAELAMFLEPLPCVRVGHQLRVDARAEPLAKLVGVASALGNSAAYVWLKLPACADYATVTRATTLPILILGGEVAGEPLGFYRQLAAALSAGSQVRGTMIGRNVLYPPGADDPLVPAQVVHALVHERIPLDQLTSRLQQTVTAPLDTLTRWVS